MASIQLLFTPAVTGRCTESQPAVSQSLDRVRGQVEGSTTEFNTWRQMLSVGHQDATGVPDQTSFTADFSAAVETSISTVLCAVQTLVRRSEQLDHEAPVVDEGGEEEKPVEDLLKPGHLTRLLQADVEADVEALCVGEVNVCVNRLLSLLHTHEDSCPRPQEANRAARVLLRLQPLLGVYSDLVRHYLAVSMGAHRSTGKLLSVLAGIFTELAQKGFCLPQELLPGGDGEGATEFHDYEGGGIGEGEGTKDVSDKIENEDQVEDTHQEGQEKEEQQEQGNIKSEDNAIEMSEDFDGQMHDGDENEPGDDDKEEEEEDEDELDKKMGHLGEGQTDTLDERLWGDDEDEEGSDNEEESGQGTEQGESELVAKDDNVDAAESNKDKKNQEKDSQSDQEEHKEQIHEQGDERDFDENEVDPYHGQQENWPEPEAMDLPEDLNLDQQDEAGDGDGEGDEENPLDIEDKAMELEEKESEETDGGEEQSKAEESTDTQPEQEQEAKPEEEEVEEGGDKAEGEEGSTEHEAEGEEEKSDGETGGEQDRRAPEDSGAQPKEEQEEEEEWPDAGERKEHSTAGQTGEENLQSDSAVELAGEASERDQAKEEHGSGAADASQSEGHQSKLTARMASQSQTERHTQSFKRKPGHADNERSTGDYNERINKRLRTVESQRERAQERSRDARLESELYQHVQEEDTAYDTQTYDVANAEQQKAMGPNQNQDEDQKEDVAMEIEKEEELQAAETEELKPETLDTPKASRKGVDSGEMELQTQVDEDKEEERWKDRRQQQDEERAERSTESSIHTIPELLLLDLKKEECDLEEMRREMEMQLESWHRCPAGTQEEEGQAASMWHQYQTLTWTLSQQLCEQLRLILEPTQAAKLRGDYRTGKRLNMRKVIPYIASQFRKDKIWLRRTKPSKRDYQICLAVDDSSSMVDNHSKQLAFESLSVIINALTLLEVGQVSVCSFGEQVQLLHPFQQQFSDESGARILRLCQFQQKKTRIAQFLETSTKLFVAARQQVPGTISCETAQLLVIVSDGRGLFLEGKDRVMAAVRAARTASIFIIFVVLDNPNSRDSILDIKVPVFRGPGEMPEIRSYMDEFPFPFYVILRDVNALPETLSDALRQWFELVTAAEQ